MINEKFKTFALFNLSGEFQIRNWFEGGTIPRIFYLQANSRLLHTYKIAHSNSDCRQIKNQFSIPEKSGHVVTPEGTCLMIGGYLPLLQIYLKNTFVFDDYHQVFINKQHMHYSRADHATIYIRGFIYVLGGISDEPLVGQVAEKEARTLNICEVYSVE